MDEVWRAVVGFEASHEVSDLGRLRTVARMCRGSGLRRDGGLPMRSVPMRILGLRTLRNGYKRSTISIENRQHQRLVHRLVAEAFLGPPPSTIHQVNHIDGNKANNCINNLEWRTRQENGKHAYATGLSISRKGTEHWRSKLTDAQIVEIKSLIGTASQREIASRFGVQQPQISRIATGKRWAHLGEKGFHTPAP